MSLRLLKDQNLITFLSVSAAAEEERSEADEAPAVGAFVESSIFWFFLGSYFFLLQSIFTYFIYK